MRLAQESEGTNEESSVNIETVSYTPATKDVVAISCNEDSVCNGTSLPSGTEPQINTETSAERDTSASDGDLFKNGVSARNEVGESFFTKSPSTIDESSVTRETHGADDDDNEITFDV